MKKEKLFRLKACTILTGLLFLSCLTAGSASANYVTSLDFSTDDDWVQENTITGTDFVNGKAKLYSTVNYGADFSAGANAIASSIYKAEWDGDKLLDDNITIPWHTAMGNYANQWVKIDLGPETTRVATKVRIYPARYDPNGGQYIKNYHIDGSNDGTNFDVLVTDSFNQYDPSDWKEKTFDNIVAYRYYRLFVVDSWTPNYYVAAFELELLESVISYSPSQPYYIYSANSQIDTTLWDTIASITTTETTPINTSLKYLVSFDGKHSWKYWTGSAWATSNLDDLHINGMTKTDLEAINETQWSLAIGFAEGTLDFAIDLSTTDANYTPELSDININYLQTTYDSICNSIDNWELGYTPEEKEQLYWLYKNGKKGLNSDNVIINDTEWQYYADEFLPGEDPENPFDIGYSYVYNGMKFIKLGSGIGQPLGNAVPELPAGVIPLLVVILSFGLRRLKHSHK